MKKTGITATAVFSLFLVWFAGSAIMDNPLLLPGPIAVFSAFGNIITEETGLLAIGTTLLRLALAMGVGKYMPWFVTLLAFFSLSSFGFPGTNSFIGEFLVLAGAFEHNTWLALAAYNWGPGNVDRKTRTMPEETRNYVSRVTGHYRDFKA